MKVKALNDGTIGRGNDVRRVRKGQVFDLPEGHKIGRWMIPLADVVAEEPKGKAVRRAQKAPETLSQMAPSSGSDLV
jgi:hypothetical protein